MRSFLKPNGRASEFGGTDAPFRGVAARKVFNIDWLLLLILSTTAAAVERHRLSPLNGLFTAHNTGNLLVLAAHYVTKGFSQIGPLLSVPVFIAVPGAATMAFGEVRNCSCVAAGIAGPVLGPSGQLLGV